MGTPKTPDWVVFEGSEIAKVLRVRNRLYTEMHLNGDDMRDLAQMLDAFLRAGIEASHDEIGRK